MPLVLSLMLRGAMLSWNRPLPRSGLAFVVVGRLFAGTVTILPAVLTLVAAGGFIAGAGTVMIFDVPGIGAWPSLGRPRLVAGLARRVNCISGAFRGCVSRFNAERA